MNWKRWSRDLLILTVCGAVSYGCYWWFSQPAANVSTVDAELQSVERQVADLALQRRTWNIAADNLEKLVKNDPYNGFAWYNLGLARWNLCRPIIDARTQELNAAQPDPNRLQELQDKLTPAIASTREALQGALDSARYRNPARYLLAVIHVYQGEVEEAVELLHVALDDGYVRRNGIDSPEMTPVQAHPDYVSLKTKETANLRAASYLMPVLPRRQRTN